MSISVLNVDDVLLKNKDIVKGLSGPCKTGYHDGGFSWHMSRYAENPIRGYSFKILSPKYDDFSAWINSTYSHILINLMIQTYIQWAIDES